MKKAIIAITVLGALLRLVLLDGQLTHDELSALLRTSHDSFSDLIQQGVCPDGHPALVQSFLWLWCHVLGCHDWLVRLPFTLMGIAAIPLAAHVARLWFNRQAGVFAAAVMAATQCAVYYSALARPYIPGLLFTLLMLCSWSRLVLYSDRRLRHVIGMALCAALCAYTHQFAMLTAALTAIAGLFLCRPSTRPRYLLACAGAVALFLPHLPITWHQLTQLQGIGGWLAAPTPDFAGQYLCSLLHFSPLLALATLAWIASCSRFSRAQLRLRKKRLFAALILWALPLVIGFAYSVAVNPVLQFSCLIFSWPFLILVACALFTSRPQSKRLVRPALTLLWLVVATTTLFANRHLEHHRQQVFESSCLTAWQLQDADADAPLVWIAADSAKLGYYERLFHRPLHNQATDLTLAQLDRRIDTASASCLVTSCTSLYELEVILHHYPTLVQAQHLTRSSVLTLSRTPQQVHAPMLSRHIEFAPTDEFTPLLDTTLKNLTHSRHTILKALVRYQSDTLATQPPMLVMETLLGNSKVDYQCEPLDKMPFPGEAMIVRDLNEVSKSDCNLGRLRVKVYIWNPDRNAQWRPTQFELHAFPANPYIFSVDERI